MKWKAPEAVQQVREWRDQMAREYEGLPWEEVQKRLNAAGQSHRDWLEAEKKRRKEAPQEEAPH